MSASVLALFTVIIPPFASGLAYATGNVTSSTGFTPEPSKKPKYTVVGYITAYLYNDFYAVGCFDAAITTAIEEQITAAMGDRKIKASDAEKRQIEVIRRNEREKRLNSAYAPYEPQGRSTTALSPLYKVLYPGTNYRIISVRDITPKARDTTKQCCFKEVTLELRYPDAGCAPYHKGKRVKKGIVKVRLRKWNWPLEYKVCGYVPVREGMEYFTLAKGGVLNRSTPEGV